MTDRPLTPDGSTPIDVRPSTVACPCHGEHLRADWPRGFMVFSVTIIKAALESEALHEAASAIDQRNTGEPRILAINSVLAKRPACYFVERAVVQDALMECGILRIGLCETCGQSNLSGPYNVIGPASPGNILTLGKQITVNLCLTCALNAGDRMHAAFPNGGVWKV